MRQNDDKQDSVEVSAQADRLVKHYAFKAGLTGFIPVPMLDVVGLISVQRTMVYRLCKLYKVPYSLELSKTLLKSLLGTVAGKAVMPLAGSALKIIPGVGLLAGSAGMAALGSASSYASGKVFQKHFERGGTLQNMDLAKAKAIYQAEMEKGRQIFLENK